MRKMARALPVLLVLFGFLNPFASAEGQMRSPRGPRSTWESGVIYQVFVRSFQDSNGDGIGDLRGIISRLDYLGPKGLGADALWVTPVFASPSYHGYDVLDFRSVQAQLGDRVGFEDLIRAAHSRGIRMILDIPINHTSRLHPWFREERQSRQPPAPTDRYLWRAEDPRWPGPSSWFHIPRGFYYGIFGPALPDLNWLNPWVREELRDSLAFWARYGVDGFRIDAARHLVEGPSGEFDTPETHRALAELIGTLKAEFPRLTFFGEIWSNARDIAPYIDTGRELDYAFHFPASAGLQASLRSGTAREYRESLVQTLAAVKFPERLAPFVTNHDMIRISHAVSGDPRRLALAATAYLTLPGVPVVYYGEEIGMTNGILNDDLGKRTPMQWTNAPNRGFTAPGATPWLGFSSMNPALSVESQIRDPSSLIHAYRDLIRRRRQDPALRSGRLELIPESPDPSVLLYVRRLPGAATLVALNFGARPIPPFTVRVPLAGRARRAEVPIAGLAVYGTVIHKVLP